MPTDEDALTDVSAPHVSAGKRPAPGRLALHRIVPWFILAFLAMAGLCSAGLLSTVALQPITTTANVLTIVSMAALGLGVDVRSVAGAGLRVTLAVVASLVALTAVSLGLIRILGIACGHPPDTATMIPVR